MKPEDFFRRVRILLVTVAAAGNHRAGIVVVFRVRLALFLSFFFVLSRFQNELETWRVPGVYLFISPCLARGWCFVPCSARA